MIVALIVFSIVILIHEFGHFIVAKKNGIRVYEFAMGMGPALLKKQGKETLYTLRLFPIGGYVRMQGEDEEDFEPTSFNAKSPWQKISVVSAGVVMNVILAFICFIIVNYATFYPTLEIGEVFEGYPAEQVGLQSGDKITKLNGHKVRNYADLTFRLYEDTDAFVDVEVVRDGQKYQMEIERKVDPDTGRYLIGFSPSYKYGVMYKNNEGDRVTIIDSITESFKELIFYIIITIKGFIQLITFQLSFDNVAGPIGIVSSISDGFSQSVAYSGLMLGIINTINFIGVISVNLAVFNFLPIPALDGGRIVFLLFEAITGKRVPAEKEGYIHFVGFVALMLFAVFVAYKDIIRIFS